MLDRERARLWAASPDFRENLAHWHWFRQAMTPALQAAAARHPGGEALAMQPEALARAFWAWQASLEPDREFEARNPLDFAHFACGLLLQNLLLAQPLRAPADTAAAPREAAVRALTQVALTLLSAWRTALQAPVLADTLDAVEPRLWASYLENIHDEPGLAIAFLDLFSGCTPVWDTPHTVALRPGMQPASTPV